MVNKLDEGQISETGYFQSQDQREAFRIVRLDKKFEPHKANLDIDFTRIIGFALQEKQARIVDEWKEEKLVETFVKINQGYFPCDDKLNNWNSNRDD